MSWSDWEPVVGDGLDNFTEVIYKKKRHLELGGSVARISTNRPQKYNAFTDNTMNEMFRAFYDASHDPMIGVIQLTGEGDHFGTGGDVEWEQWGLRQVFYFGNGGINRLVRTSRKPVVALIKGYCIGGSNHLAYTCDHTIAADNAIFGQNGPRVSSPADGQIMPLGVRVVGAKKARELWMLCRRYSASEALEMGLINRVVRLDRLEAEADKWCEDILKASPGCIEILKAAFDWEIDTFPGGCTQAGALYPDWFDSAEGKEGSLAFMEKRKPNYWKIRKEEADKSK